MGRSERRPRSGSPVGRRDDSRERGGYRERTDRMRLPPPPRRDGRDSREGGGDRDRDRDRAYERRR